MPQPPSLTPMPLLLGTSRACSITSLEGLASLLQASHRVLELDAIRPHLKANTALRMDAANLALGEIALTSVWGSAVTLAVEPLAPLCMLALPATGWGRYQLDTDAIDNTFGETCAFLPARGWRLVNDRTGGTGIHFSDKSLLTRVMAINGGVQPPDFAMRISRPQAFKTGDRSRRIHYRQLQHALAMLDVAIRFGSEEPHPMLQLDDLILRCIAMLLFPELAHTHEAALAGSHQRDLHREIQRLMVWIRANLHRSISLTEIEQRSLYGRRSIQTGFKAVVGCGPMQWLRLQRLEAARQQLLDPACPLNVNQVGQACGYFNLSAFSRDFKSRFGIAPRQLLQSSRGRLQP